jgi:DNA mismatch repair protein MutL
MAVYGKETINNIIPIDFMKDFISVKGFIGNSNLAKSSRNNQSIFINGRIIKNKTITAAVEAAFKSMLTINKFPFFIVNLTLNPEFVDVNVHPSKAEVKFQDDQLVFKAVYAAVKDAILAITDLGINENIPVAKPSFVANVPQVEYQQQKISFTENVMSPLEISANNRQFQQNQQNNELLQNDSISENKVKDNTIYSTSNNSKENESLAYNSENRNENISQSSNRDINSFSSNSSSNKSSINDSTYKENKIDNEYVNTYGNNTRNASFTNNEAYGHREKYTPLSLNNNFGALQGNTNDPAKVVAPEYNTPARIEPLAVVGQLHFMYIVAEGIDEMYLIDQHAAHERIYYEKYLSAYNRASIQSQNLLTPMIIELSLSEKHSVLENAEVFTKLGYEIDDFGGNAVSIRAIPVIYGNPNPKELFNEIIQSMDLKTKDVYSAIDSILYKMSCKSAIKAGDKLGYKEMNELIEQLRRCDNPFNCPHGRPTIIKMSYYELEKKFKRIQ